MAPRVRPGSKPPEEPKATGQGKEWDAAAIHDVSKKLSLDLTYKIVGRTDAETRRYYLGHVQIGYGRRELNATMWQLFCISPAAQAFHDEKAMHEYIVKQLNGD